MGKRDEARADLEVYLSSPLATGAEIKKKIEEVAKYDSLVDAMQKIFKSSPSPEPASEVG